MGRGTKRRIPWVAGLKIVSALLFGAVIAVYLTLPDVRILARANPTTTAYMQLRAAEAEAEGRKVRRVHQWVPYRRISPHLKRAVLVAEDSAFWDHEGIDLEQIKVAIETAIEKGDAPRGASTITQQLAKNLYLSPSRDPLRKMKELIITRRLEAELPKARILELYLNVVEWGDGIWGAEAAARRYFGVSAASLSPAQAALLAGALINPVRYSPSHPPARLLRRQQLILARMGSVEPPAPTPVTAPEPEAPVTQEVQEAPVADPLPATGGELAPQTEAPAAPAAPD
jgi:monofunctional biosynthetic peptidoglycan transglycosylase